MRIFACLIFSNTSISSPLNAQSTKNGKANVIPDSNVSTRFPREDGPGCDPKSQGRKNHSFHTLEKWRVGDLHCLSRKEALQNKSEKSCIHSPTKYLWNTIMCQVLF